MLYLVCILVPINLVFHCTFFRERKNEPLCSNAGPGRLQRDWLEKPRSRHNYSTPHPLHPATTANRQFNLTCSSSFFWFSRPIRSPVAVSQLNQSWYFWAPHRWWARSLPRLFHPVIVYTAAVESHVTAFKSNINNTHLTRTLGKRLLHSHTPQTNFKPLFFVVWIWIEFRIYLVTSPSSIKIYLGRFSLWQIRHALIGLYFGWGPESTKVDAKQKQIKEKKGVFPSVCPPSS